MTAAEAVERWRRARRDRRLAILEGFHPLKHALRFGAEILQAVSPDPAAVADLAAALAPDVERSVGELVEPVDESLFRRLVPRPPATGVVAIARRPGPPPVDPPDPAPVVFLERPRRMGNIGAVVRVAAAAGAAGVTTSGPHDPWSPAAIRGSAGLHFAIPVSRVESLPEIGRVLVAVDPDGEPLDARSIPARSVLAFGTERHGLSEVTRARAERRVSIPMRAGVSSLNLATAVAVTLYAWRLGPALESGGPVGDIRSGSP